MKSKESDIVREVRERATRIEGRFGHDLHKYCEYLREQEKKHPDRTVDQIVVVRSVEEQNEVIPRKQAYRP